MREKTTPHNQMEAFYRLSLLIEQRQFELLMSENKCRVVYLMNDAVESFLVFRNYRMVGEYDPDYEGEPEIWLELGEKDEDYLLAVRQGAENAFTISFENLDIEDHLYNYGEIGHFWVRDYEYLRVLEYRLAILKDKLDYLGEKSCTQKEKKLALLAGFPPLLQYPAVPEAYRNSPADPWEVTAETIEAYICLAEEAGDKGMERHLKRYRKNPSASRAKFIGKMLRRKKHGKTVDLLNQKLRDAASVYPDRSFGEEDIEYQRLYRKGQEWIDKLSDEHIRAELLREEPFICARDSITYKVYIMIYQDGFLNRRTLIRSLEQGE
ncbi:MAG: DUF3878 family protein [Blautia sp.]|nr:DUF3878 family protein [Blautia sp.]